MNRAALLFGVIFSASLLFQITLWAQDDFTDQMLWVRRLENLIPHQLVPEDLTEKRYSSTPGTGALLLGRVFYSFGANSLPSLQLSVATIVSIASGGIAVLFYRIHKNIWVAAASGTIAFAHPLYLQASPVDAVIAPLLSLLTVFWLWYAIHQHRTTVQHDLLVSAIIGASLATRFHLAAPVAGLGLLGMVYIIGIRRVLIIGSAACVFMFALNPFLSHTPRTYVEIGILEQFGYFTGENIHEAENRSLVKRDLLFLPFAGLSILLTILHILYKPLQASQKTPRYFLVYYLLATGTVTALLLIAALQSLRYVFPLILMWEIFLPLLLCSFVPHIRFHPPLPPAKQAVVARILYIGIFIATAGSAILLTRYALSLPPVEVFIDWEKISPLLVPEKPSNNL